MTYVAIFCVILGATGVGALAVAFGLDLADALSRRRAERERQRRLAPPPRKPGEHIPWHGDFTRGDR
jgi:hypothetical protein